MASLQAIGSVVTIGERRYVVAGHRLVRDGEGMGPGYVLVPYPLGFVGAESLALVAASQVGEVVHEGLATDDGTAYLEQFEALAAESASIPSEVFEYEATLLRGLAQEGVADA